MENSINFPLNKCSDDFFMKWDQRKISQDIIKNKAKRALFDQRKRMFVYIIASQSEITHDVIEHLPKIFKAEHLRECFTKYILSQTAAPAKKVAPTSSHA